MRIFSGIQPTGEKHLGNLIGGFRQYAATQEQGVAFFCIVDLHSITTDYDPADLHARTLDLYAMLIATGLDPERSTVFAQSHVTAHAEAAWLLSAVSSYGQLGRMTQFKEKADRKDFVSAGLFTYPVLMAGDILLYQADIVPIGDDQRQHLELARDVAERFNTRFGDTFTVPQGVYPEVGARIMDLQEPTRKMSTTGGTPQGTIGLLDPPDVVRKKFRSAVTDSGREVQRSDDKPGVSNLIDILSVASGQAPAEIEAQLRRQRLRPVQAGRRRGGRRAARAGAGAVRRAPGRRGRAAAAAGARRRQGTGRLEPDARADVRGDGLRAAVKRIGLIIAVIFAVVVVAGVLHYTDAPPVAVFVLSGVALGGVAWAIGIATESVGAKFGPAVTGVLQSTLGNLPEFFIVIFSLSAGELVVAQFSILGSLFANALLVLGLAIAVGATSARDGVMRFQKRLPNDTATLLLLSVFLISILGLSDQAGDKASEHQVAISVVGAICLLIVYAAWLVAYLRADKREEQQPAEPAHNVLPFTWAIALLAVAGISAALVSDWFVDAIDPAVEKLGISKAFTGLVIVAIAGNAVENVVAIQLARKGQSELALSVVKNSVSQISCFLFPALVLVSLLFTEQLTFVIDPVYVGALALTAIAVWQITGDGEAVLFEGMALVAFYVVLATLVWFE